MNSTPTIAAIGRRIRRLRESKGYSRNELARRIDVDVSSIAGWEGGKRLPRDSVRARLAETLDCELTLLMSPQPDTDAPTTVSILDVGTEFPRVLTASIRAMRHSLRAVRLTAPAPTAQHVLREARLVLADRISSGSISIQRIEIFYSLDRLKETLSNILRYDGKPFYVRSCCIGLKEIAPFLGGYCLDDSDLILGTYHVGMPPQGYPVLHLRGPAVKPFFASHWNEIWSRGTLLNPHGARDLSAVREAARTLGLPARQWPWFIEQARALDVGDGAPPLI